MQKENIVDVDADAERVSDLMQTETLTHGGEEHSLQALAGDIQKSHAALDEHKQGSLALSQDLNEAAKQADDDALRAILTDMSNGAFSIYLRLHRGDMELMGKRDGEYSGFLTE
jgi:hypothetical protein